jgi:hypothetical protein
MEANTKFEEESYVRPRKVFHGERTLNYNANTQRGVFMADTDRNRLEKRRDEILEQLTQVNKDLQTSLDNDPEEQAIEIEQEEVAIAQERNLRRELAAIEEQLQDR